MRNILKVFLLFAILSLSFGYQIGIKTKGVKTGNFHHNYSSNEIIDYSSSSLVHNDGSISIPFQSEHQSEIVDETWKFLNETRSKMASGICHKEVPTASLVRNPSVIPAGNGSDPTLSKIQVCCEGYERNAHNFHRCDPVCSDGCPNGICVGPNTCVCYPGHVRNLAQFCIPTCPIGCGNGECDLDGSCICKPGYVLDIEKKFCIAVCSHGCVNGNCTAPDVCQCNQGFKLYEEGGSCEPHCENCEFGKCTAPGVCKCLEGYDRVDNKCEPICTKGCENGVCSAPETCTCKSGFTFNESKNSCIAHCDQPCVNGFCDGPNKCTCNEGYMLDGLYSNICKPNCPNGCPNGFCSAPNFCLCKFGYVKSGIKGKQQCTPV